MANCNHDCSSCKENCNERTEIKKLELNKYSSIKKTIGIVSGKGGVGKSLVTSLLAVASNNLGYSSCILDGDILGPSIPHAFGIKQGVFGSEEGLISPATSKNGIDIISTNLILENEEDPVIWRGSLLTSVINQFYSDVVWFNKDVMYIDMPPGTGDVPLTVFQQIPLDGIIIVTSPQDIVSMIVSKACNMAKMMNIPILAIVENYSYFVCSSCKEKHYLFGESKIDEVSKKHGIKNVIKLPLDPKITSLVDKGEIEEVEIHEFDELIKEILHD